MHTPFSPLLPLQGMSITLRFLANAEFSYFHQMTVDAFTRYLLDSPKDYQTSITSEAPESGRLFYKPDDTYRFSVLTFAGQSTPFTPLLRMLHDLPNAAPIKSPNAPLRDNIKLDSIIDLIDGQAISNSSGMGQFTARQLIDISHSWQNDKTTYPRHITLQWLSPVRLLRSSDARSSEKLEGEAKFCRDKTQLTPGLLVKRINESLFNLMQTLGHQGVGFDAQAYDNLPLQLVDADLFWLDTPYYSEGGETNTTGGMVGYCRDSTD